MDVRHWTEDQFVNRIYGLEGGDEAHLNACAECRERWANIVRRRSVITAEPEVSSEFLAAQRRAIYARLDQAPSHRYQWASAFAATLMVVVGLMVFRPGDAPKPQPAVHGEDKVLSEIYSLEQSSEPVASKTMHVMFEEK